MIIIVTILFARKKNKEKRRKIKLKRVKSVKIVKKIHSNYKKIINSEDSSIHNLKLERIYGIIEFGCVKKTQIKKGSGFLF